MMRSNRARPPAPPAMLYHWLANRMREATSDRLVPADQWLRFDLRRTAARAAQSSGRSGLFRSVTVRLTALSSTKAKRTSLLRLARPISNAPPSAASTLNWRTKRPVVVNSTISLGWVGTSLTASPLAVSRFPFGALRYRKDRVVGRRCDKEDIVLRIVSEPGRSQDQRGDLGTNRLRGDRWKIHWGINLWGELCRRRRQGSQATVERTAAVNR